MAGEVASISSGYLCKVWEIKSLGWDQDAEANHLLQSMAKQVEPIMRKRRWRVTLLSEFCPRNPSLLGLNVGGGQEIKIRLRPHNRRTEFLPYESLLGTMLHELTHNVHSQHNANFYKLLDEITLECEDLIAKGVTGSQKDFGGFGKRLGGHSHNPSLLSLRSTIATAAEKRLQAGMLMPPGPHCLGGDRHIMKALTPIQAAAMAAERRQQDDIWCGSAATASEDKCTRASAESSTSSVAAKRKAYELDPCRSTTMEQRNAGTTRKTGSDEKQTNDGATRKTNIDNAQEVGIWECTVCTLLNPPLAPVCGACGAQDLDSRKKSRIWRCKFCTLENEASSDRCLACNEWRFSRGA